MPEARIVQAHGVPALSINGSLQTGFTRAGWHVENFADFAKVGVHLFSPIITASQGFWEPAVWTAPDAWDYRRIDVILQKILAATPDAWVMPRIELAAPTWWSKAHPGEMVQTRGEDGRIVPLLIPKPKPGGANNLAHGAPSWASQLWLNDTEKALANLVHHIEASPYGNRVIGYMVCSGESHEWFGWGNVADWSPPSLAAFRAWLKGRYPADKDLQAAWNSPGVTLENAEPPAEAQVNDARFGSLRDPQAEQQIVDYQQYASAVTGEAIDRLCRATKKAASHSVIVGTFYGYSLASDPRWGHEDIDRIVRSPNVDFLSSPTFYWEHRQLGVACPGPMAPLGTVQLHGKQWFSETDLRTSLTGSEAGWFQGKVADVATDILFERREMAWILCSGVGHWWFDVGNIRYDTPPLMEEIGRLNNIAEMTRDVSRTPEDQVAAVLDPASIYYVRPGDPLLNELRRLQTEKLVRSGMASQNYSSGDLSALKDKKLIVFCDMIAPTQAMRREIESLKSDGRILVFLWAAGAVYDHALSAKSMEALTGIHIRPMMEGASLRTTLDDCGGIAPGLKGTSYGPQRKVAPVFLPDDPAAEVWGRLATGEPALVVKRYQEWTAVYSSAPLLPPEVFSVLGGQAKIHRYLPAGDAVWASKGIIGVTAFTSGMKTLRFPQPVDLYDLYDDRSLGVHDAFEIPFQKNETKLFRKMPKIATAAKDAK